MVLPFKESIIYGPVNSRRLGKSLGVNLLPFRGKYCSFDCLYCHYGRTTSLSTAKADPSTAPAVADVLREVEKALVSGTVFDYVTFSGNGEPTLYPYFSELVSQLKPLIVRHRPEVKLALLSNSTTVARADVRQTIRQIDFPIMKLDGGKEEVVRGLNRPAQGFDFQEMVNGLKQLPEATVQTLFVQGMFNNIDDESVIAWTESIKAIKPRGVQIYSTDRPTAHSGLKLVEKQRLAEIASLCSSLTGVPVDVY